MAKRFTDTDKYKKPFIRGLQGAYKVLWDYLYHDCDHAGIWIVDFEIAQIYVGADLPINKKDAIKYFNDGEERVIILNSGSKWFIPSFIEFQYGLLNEENRAHRSVIAILKKYKLYSNKGLIRGLQARKDKDKDKVKETIIPFSEFWELYDHKKGDKKACEKKWIALKDSERTRVIETLPNFKGKINDKQFQPHPSTYLNQRRWEDEIEVTQKFNLNDYL